MDDDIELSGEGELGDAAAVEETGEQIELSDKVYWGFTVDKETTAVEALKKWYSNLPSQRLDLVAELGDSRGVFVIHGDSLVSHIVGNAQFGTGKMFIHAVFLVERYLDMFIKAKNGKSGIRVVFFDNMRVCFEKNHTTALLRELVILHLVASLGTEVVKVFADWQDAEFEKFIASSDISSFILSDDYPATPVDEGEELVSALFIAFAVHVVTCFRVRIAFFDRLEQRGDRIVAFSVGAERRHELVSQKAVEALGPVFQQLREESREEESLPIINIEGDLDIRLEVFSVAARLLLEELGPEVVDSEEGKLVVSILKIFAITIVISSSLSLEDRVHSTFDASDWVVFDPENDQGYFEHVWAQLSIHLGRVLKGITCGIITSSLSAVSVSGNICDLFDERILRTVSFLLWKEGAFAGTSSAEGILGLTPQGASYIKSFWSRINSGDVFDLSIQAELPSPFKSESELFVSPKSKSSGSPELVALTSKFVLLDRATAAAQSMGPLGTSIVKHLSQVPQNSDLELPHASIQIGSYIPETQLVTKRFENKKKRDYEDQKAKWKHLSIDKLASRMRNWELRGAQKELRAMHQYAKSLVGADCLHHPIALVQDKAQKRTAGASAAPKVDTPAVEEGVPKMGKKAMEIIARNVAAQQKSQANKDSDQIKPLIERAEALAECRDFKSFETALFDLCSGYSRILDSFDGFRGISSSVKLEASQIKVISAVLKSCKSVLKRLAPSATGHMASEEARLGLRSICARIVRLCVCFVQEYAEIESKEIVRVQEVLLSMGFSHTSKNLYNMWKTRAKQEELQEEQMDKKAKKKDKDKKKEETAGGSSVRDEAYVKSSKVDVFADVTGGDEYLFQLFHLTADLDRPSGTLADKRVMFKPDYWQKELLDIVDRNESALVCAPTASGKTFICYYAMEKVLRTSNDKVAVYVAPSKALMNQVDAEIYARFRSKTYPATDHFQLSGDLEKDYQHNPFDCQVLVTIPSMLEQLLLDPTMQDWVKRIEYVIFDEVHCMGESADEAAIWEHALQLIPCPFLAMSATVGNPGKFHAWLNCVASLKSGPKVHLIEYKERFNDLQKLSFDPERAALLNVHPFTLLSFQDVMSGVIPPDLTMTPQETALLVSAIRRAVSPTEANLDQVKQLIPRKVFEKQIPVDSMVTKRQFREYERFVLKEFIRLSEIGDCIDESVFSKIQSLLALSPRAGDAKSINEVWNLASASSSSSKPSGGAPVHAINVIDAISQASSNETHYLDASWLCEFLTQLDQYTLLPAIIFNLDRAEIMKMAERLSEHLRQGQYEKYYGTEERAYATRAINKKRMDAYEAQLARRRMMERKNKKDEDFDESEISQGIPPPVMVEDEFDPEYSFAGVKALSDPECHELIDKLGESSRKIKPWIIEGLRRGIGMHHEGCSTRLKKTVEVLFRRGFLRVVIATGTLSLGINMPCKSTIFVGTHVKLNALNYRQMAGRAGRRGFDLVGNVIFVDSTIKNIRRLLTSELTQLGGDYALTPSHVLRAQIMVKHLQENNQLTERIEKHLLAMLMGGFMPFNVGASASSLPILRSNIDFLVREGLLTKSGQVTKLGSLAAFLFKREPENIVISRILLSRDLLTEVDSWLQNQRQDQPTSMATFKLMQVLASFCFGRPQLRGSALREIAPRKRNQPTDSCPLLDPVNSLLPSSIRDIAQGFNQRVIDNVVSRIMMTLPEMDELPPLPATGKRVVPSSESAVTLTGPLSSLLHSQKLRDVRVRSIYSALSGKGDTFESAQELVMNAQQRPDLLLDNAAVPTIPSGRISSYACDFLLHGKLSLLQNDCLIGVSESWKEIDDWRFFLESLNIALEFMFELDNTHEYAHLQKVVKDLTVEISTKLHLEGA